MLDIKLSNGRYVVEGKRICSFTDAEEVFIDMDEVVPFLLESRLRENSAIFEHSGVWECHVCADQRVVTGQNLQSGLKLGELLVEEIHKVLFLYLKLMD